MRVLVTGASGFVGSALVRRLIALGHDVTGVYRTAPKRPQGPALLAPLDALDASRIPQGSDAIVHAAARVHVLRDSAADPLAEYREVNVQATLTLAYAAARSGVRRFVFLSTIKVNGECTPAGGSFRATDPAAPVDPYGRSKWEAEQGLEAIAAETGLEVCIIRPPLIYGPGVKGNFRSMLNWLRRGVPLPLGAVRNRRSLVYLDNLIDLIVLSAEHDEAANRVLLVADNEHLSTPDLLSRAARSLGRRARLIAVPTACLRAAAALAGRQEAARRLCESLVVDAGDTRRILGWEPAVSVDEGLARTAESFLREARA